MSGMQPPLKNTEPADVRGARLERYMHRTIPLVEQMRVRVAALDGAGLTLTAPLAPNINHEQTAFGGSLASLATLACWGYLWLLLEDEPGMHMVVNEAHIRYLKPVTGALTARCEAPPGETLQKFLDTLKRRGKARIELKATSNQDGSLCAEYTGSFVAYRGEEPRV
ncbi:MAG TPA: YiiD C-terminal domain-containing protein [Gammaproteobacteria bacterium]|nr:YiiD C-terminal domain-containing protein [Gammaproteobacteria bacterium]